MSTIRENEDEFVKNLAVSELTGLKDTITEFIATNTINKEGYDKTKETETKKQLLNEEQNGKKNK
tara:strand:+ start:507 stop:701 length:195 start_codon:yes stop_codon:yes gene_type:complete